MQVSLEQNNASNSLGGGWRKTLTALLPGLILGAGFLWYGFFSSNSGDWYRHLHQVEWPYVLAFLLVYYLYFVLKSYRWGLLLKTPDKVSMHFLMPTTVAGYSANLVIPHSGELIRALKVKRRYSMSTAPVLASIGVERIFDLLSILAISALVFLLSSAETHSVVEKSALILMGISFGLIAAMLVVMRFRKLFRSIAALVLRPLPEALSERVLQYLGKVLKSLDELRTSAALWRVIGVSLAQWILILFCIWLCIESVGLHADILSLIALQLLLVVGIALPTAPGYVGTMQICFLLIGTHNGWADSQTMAASILYNLLISLPVFIWTGWYLYRDRREAAQADRLPNIE